MKSFLKSVIIIVLIILSLSCLESNLDMVGVFALNNITVEDMAEYDGYYFNQLTTLQKKIYIKMDKKINAMETKVTLGNYDISTINDDVNEVYTAFLYDNPKYYNLSNSYEISTVCLGNINYSTLKLSYIYNIEEVEKKDQQLHKAVQDIINVAIKPGMSEFEKELALHDELVKRVNYYEFENIEDIPTIKHTAYAALVENEAVCDGYSKAFKLLLDKANIECIIVGGNIDTEPHAWNMVKLDESYYNVDVTSNSIKDASNKYVIHRYFNVSNSSITLTHSFDEVFTYPDGEDTQYNYYTYNDYFLNYSDNIYSKLKEIASKQEKYDVLEVMVDNRYYVQTLIDTLYDINFNNWKTSGKKSVKYNKLEDIYVFIK